MWPYTSLHDLLPFVGVGPSSISLARRSREERASSATPAHTRARIISRKVPPDATVSYRCGLHIHFGPGAGGFRFSNRWSASCNEVVHLCAPQRVGTVPANPNRTVCSDGSPGVSSSVYAWQTLQPHYSWYRSPRSAVRID